MSQKSINCKNISNNKLVSLSLGVRLHKRLVEKLSHQILVFICISDGDFHHECHHQHIEDHCHRDIDYDHHCHYSPQQACNSYHQYHHQHHEHHRQHNGGCLHQHHFSVLTTTTPSSPELATVAPNHWWDFSSIGTWDEKIKNLKMSMMTMMMIKIIICGTSHHLQSLRMKWRCWQ